MNMIAAAQTPMAMRTIPFLVYLGMKKSMQRKMKARMALQRSQSAMKETFSMRQRCTLWPLLPLVPQDTLSTLQKAQMSMTWEQAPWQTIQLMASMSSLKTKLVWVGRWTSAIMRQLAMLMQVMTNTSALQVELNMSLRPLILSIQRYTPRTLQMTNPISRKVQNENMQLIQCALLVHQVPKRLQVTLRMIMNMQMSVSTQAAYWMTQLEPDWTIVVQRANRQKAGMRQPLTNPSRARNMDTDSRIYFLMKLWLDSIALQQQFLKTQRKAKQLEFIHLLRWIISCSWDFIGSVYAIASGTYWRQNLRSCWQQMPRLRILSSARYMLAYRQSLSQWLGSSIILKYFLYSRFCQNFQP